MHQVKEKFGGLRFYYSGSGRECCRRFHEEWPAPPASDEADFAAWNEKREQHRASAEHEAESAAGDNRSELMQAAVRRAESFASHTCERTGVLGVSMVDHGWFHTLDPATAPEGAQMSGPWHWSPGNTPPTQEELVKRVRYLDDEVERWFAVARHLRRALHAERETPLRGVDSASMVTPLDGGAEC